MTNKLALLALVIVVASFAVGCGSKSDANTPVAPGTAVMPPAPGQPVGGSAAPTAKMAPGAPQ